mgnify:FL=1
MNKKSITILVVCLIVSVLSVSLAYYSARIIGDGKNVSVNAKELTINFDNNNEIASGIIEPGWSSTNTFSVENKSKASFTYDIVLKNYKNTTKTNGYLVYKITSTNGYNMTEYKDMPKDGENTYDLVIARGITIEPGSSNKQSYTLEIKYLDSTEDQSIDMGSTVTGSLYIVESTTNENNPYTKGTLGYQIMEDNSNIKTRTDFSTTYTDVNIGTMYKAKEENTDVYYFAGDARNNWVKFGTFNTDKTVYIGWGVYKDNYKSYITYDSMSACTSASSYNNNCEALVLWKKGDPIYWRIIRTNSDGSIKLLYHGNSPESETSYIYANECYSKECKNGDISYVDFNNSNAKIKLDDWYSNNLGNYSKYINVSSNFCNDKTIVTSGENTYLAAYYRIEPEQNPTLNCNESDIIKSNIGLITIDEIAFAGGVYSKKNDKAWYYKNSKGNSSINKSNSWWTMTGTAGLKNLYLNYTIKQAEEGVEGLITAHAVSYSNKSFRPVISLKKDLLYKSGDGSATNPYEVEDMSDTLSERLLSDKSTRPSGPRGTGFDKVYAENNTNTLYTSTEDSKTVYYFAGNATDNWVKFGKNASNQDLYWRIIRTNSDGSVRLLYHGTSTTATDAYIGTSAFNSSVDNIAYVSYMYGSLGSIPNARTNQTNSSTIKTTTDNWYTSNLEAKGYTKYLSTTAVYCNDRTYTVSDYTYFGAFTRLRRNDTPSYDCATTEDKFTVDTSTGNGKLTYPIALMTADEVSFAGGVYLKNAETWYYYNSANGSSTGSTLWWLLSPNGWYGSGASVFIVFGSSLPGYLSNSGVNDTYGVRPVISIKGENLWKSGDGTASSPYEIITD